MGYGAAYDLVHNSPDVDSVTVADFDLGKAHMAADSFGTESIEASRSILSMEFECGKRRSGRSPVKRLPE